MTVQKLLSYNLPLFHGLGPDAFDGIALDFSEQNWRDGQRIFDQGDKSSDVYFLLSGTVLAIYLTPEGREIVHYRFPLKTYFGELAALEHIPRTISAVTKTRAKGLVLKQGSFMDIFDNVPLVRQRVVSGLIARLRRLNDQNVELITLSVEERTMRYLQRLADDSGVLIAGGVIANAPTHSEIANSIGANREMVSRTISKLSKQGVIESSRQKIIIHKPEALIKNTT